MALARWQPTSTKRRVLTTLIAVFALLAQPMYSLVTGQVAQAAPQTIFSDDFEGGDLSGYTVTGQVGEQWVIDSSASNANNGSHSAVLSQTHTSGETGADMESNLQKHVDTTGYEDIQVSFFAKPESVSVNDYFRFRYSTDNGSTWSISDTTILNDEADGVYQEYTYDLSGIPDVSDQSQFVFRIEAYVQFSGNWLYLDDITVTGEPLPDTEAPEILPTDVVAPVSGQTYTGSIPLEGMATDNVMVERVHVYIKYSFETSYGTSPHRTMEIDHLSLDPQANPFRWDTAHSLLYSETYDVMFVAVDTAGNESVGLEIEDIEFVEGNAPVITDVTPADSTELPRSTNYQISAKVEDPSGVDSVSYRIQVMATNPDGPGMVYDQLPFGVMTDTDGDDVYTATIDTTSLPIVVNYDSDGDGTDDATVPVEYYRILVDATDSSPAANTTFGGDGEIVSFLTLAADDTPGDNDDNTGGDEDGNPDDSTGSGDSAGGDEEAAPGVPNTSTTRTVANMLPFMGVGAVVALAAVVVYRYRYARS